MAYTLESPGGLPNIDRSDICYGNETAKVKTSYGSRTCLMLRSSGLHPLQ